MKLKCADHDLRVRFDEFSDVYHREFGDECPSRWIHYGRNTTTARTLMTAKMQGYKLRRWFA